MSRSETVVVRDENGDEIFRWDAPDGKIGFVGANLQSTDLDHAQLPGTDFAGANLYWVTFIEANLEDSNFKDACLRGAILQGAHLRGANFDGADLGLDKSGGPTDLRSADLRDCNFIRATLKGATYDERTRFPDYFDPKLEGLVFGSSVSMDYD